FPESWQYSTLFTIKQSGQWLLDFVKSGLVLPHDTFVFYFDQTMYFCFFLTGDQVEDPQVYQFTDDFSGNGFILIHEHLSEWFYKEYTKVSAHYDFSTLT
ncbi:MAG: hypothetical protein MUF87_12200, partial [Anaerolineae bacterium]|nr:hypothetical protein [Anaerolineae bacterium]